MLPCYICWLPGCRLLGQSRTVHDKDRVSIGVSGAAATSQSCPASATLRTLHEPETALAQPEELSKDLQHALGTSKTKTLLLVASCNQVSPAMAQRRRVQTFNVTKL